MTDRSYECYIKQSYHDRNQSGDEQRAHLGKYSLQNGWPAAKYPGAQRSAAHLPQHWQSCLDANKDSGTNYEQETFDLNIPDMIGAPMHPLNQSKVRFIQKTVKVV